MGLEAQHRQNRLWLSVPCTGICKGALNTSVELLSFKNSNYSCHVVKVEVDDRIDGKHLFVLEVQLPRTLYEHTDAVTHAAKFTFERSRQLRW